MAISEIVKASAGSGKTYNLTERIYGLIQARESFVVALTFTKAATAEMRKRILDRIDESDLDYIEKLGLIMRAGRLHFSTFDSFFYLLLAARGEFFEIADEKETELIRESIKKAFFREIHAHEKVSELIIASRILRSSIETLADELHEDNNGRFSRNSLSDLGNLVSETAKLKNEIKLLLEKIQLAGKGLGGNLKKGVIDLSNVAVEDLIDRTALLHSDLSEWGWLGKKIDWSAAPYTQINETFKAARERFATYLINKAILRELTLTEMHLVYNAAAKRVKERERKIFFKDISEGLIALDDGSDELRPELMSLFFELGLSSVQHLLIDEFQDTSSENMALLLPLMEEILSEVNEKGEGDRSLFVVGDWKQMIYAWRGADREAVEKHLLRYQGGQLQDRVLRHNWRSTPLLISFFNKAVCALFTGDEGLEHQEHPPEKSYSGISEINLVKIKIERNQKDPIYDAMINTLKKKKEEWGCDYSEITLLFKTNTEKEALAQKLTDAGIGFAEVRGRQILASEEGVSVFALLVQLLAKAESGLISKTLALSSFSEDLTKIAEMKEQILGRYASPRGLKAVSDVLELCRGKIADAVVEVYQEEAEAFFRAGGTDAEEFLSYVFKVRNKMTIPEPMHSDRVKLATIHGAKGLQFRHVFLLWLEQSRPFPFYLPDHQCHVTFNNKETQFWETCDGTLAQSIIQSQGRERDKIEREKANVLYVAITRATHSISVFVKELSESKDENGKDDLTGKLVSVVENESFDAECQKGVNSTSWRKDYGMGGEKASTKVEIIRETTLPFVDRAADTAIKIDRSRISRSIREGIERGERIHRFLAKVRERGIIPENHDLPPDELQTVSRFLFHERVSDILFRKGTVYVEQPISNRELYGVVDRMILEDSRITLIDYKTGSLADFIDGYGEQVKRYGTIIRSLFPGKAVEAFLLLIDDEEKVVEIELN